MKILVIWPKIPILYDASTTRIVHLLKYSKKYNHSITLVSFENMTELNYKYKHELQKYCDAIETINIPKNIESSHKMSLICTLKDMFSLENILSKSCTVPTSFYSQKMQRKITELLKTKKFDIIDLLRYKIL